MLSQCKHSASLLLLSSHLGNVQLPICQYALQLAGLLPFARTASSSAATTSTSNEHVEEEFAELTYFDEPLELQLRHTAAAARVHQPSRAAAAASTAHSTPHSLSDVVQAGLPVMEQVDKSLDQIYVSHSVKSTLKQLARHNRRAVLKADQHTAEQETLSTEPTVAVASAQQSDSSEGPTDTQHQQSLHRQVLQDLDSNAFNEAKRLLKQQQARLEAQNQALAALHSVWQQAEPPKAVRGNELKLIDSYQAVLQLSVQFRQLLQHDEQQLQNQQQESQQHLAQPTAPSAQKPGTRSRRKKKAAAASGTGDSSSSTSDTAGTNSVVSSRPPSPSAGHSGAATAPDIEAAAAAAASGESAEEQLASWVRSRKSVLNELKIRELIGMFEAADWPLPSGSNKRGTAKKRGPTKVDYIEALLQREKTAVKALLAQRAVTN